MMTGGCIEATFPPRKAVTGIFRTVGLAILVMALSSGCTGHKSDPKTPEEIVAQRAQARWDALIAGQWETAYSLASPAYRSLVDVDGFRRQKGGETWVMGTAVRKVECAIDTCEVMVRLKFKPPMPQFGTEMETDYTERWVLDEGDWWIFLTP